MFDMQVASHLKGLAEKAQLNEKHVRIDGFIRLGRPLSLLNEPSVSNYVLLGPT